MSTLPPIALAEPVNAIPLQDILDKAGSQAAFFEDGQDHFVFTHEGKPYRVVDCSKAIGHGFTRVRTMNLSNMAVNPGFHIKMALPTIDPSKGNLALEIITPHDANLAVLSDVLYRRALTTAQKPVLPVAREMSVREVAQIIFRRLQSNAATVDKSALPFKIKGGRDQVYVMRVAADAAEAVNGRMIFTTSDDAEENLRGLLTDLDDEHFIPARGSFGDLSVVLMTENLHLARAMAQRQLAIEGAVEEYKKECGARKPNNGVVRAPVAPPPAPRAPLPGRAAPAPVDRDNNSAERRPRVVRRDLSDNGARVFDLPPVFRARDTSPLDDDSEILQAHTTQQNGSTTMNDGQLEQAESVEATEPVATTEHINSAAGPASTETRPEGDILEVKRSEGEVIEEHGDTPEQVVLPSETPGDQRLRAGLISLGAASSFGAVGRDKGKGRHIQKIENDGGYTLTMESFAHMPADARQHLTIITPEGNWRDKAVFTPLYEGLKSGEAIQCGNSHVIIGAGQHESVLAYVGERMQAELAEVESYIAMPKPPREKKKEDVVVPRENLKIMESVNSNFLQSSEHVHGAFDLGQTVIPYVSSRSPDGMTRILVSGPEYESIVSQVTQKAAYTGLEWLAGGKTRAVNSTEPNAAYVWRTHGQVFAALIVNPSPVVTTHLQGRMEANLAAIKEAMQPKKEPVKEAKPTEPRPEGPAAGAAEVVATGSSRGGSARRRSSESAADAALGDVLLRRTEAEGFELPPEALLRQPTPDSRLFAITHQAAAFVAPNLSAGDLAAMNRFSIYMNAYRLAAQNPDRAVRFNLQGHWYAVATGAANAQNYSRVAERLHTKDGTLYPSPASMKPKEVPVDPQKGLFDAFEFATQMDTLVVLRGTGMVGEDVTFISNDAVIEGMHTFSMELPFIDLPQ